MISVRGFGVGLARGAFHLPKFVARNALPSPMVRAPLLPLSCECKADVSPPQLLYFSVRSSGNGMVSPLM